MPDLASDLAAIRARCEAATLGPWVATEVLNNEKATLYRAECLVEPCIAAVHKLNEDAAFIAHARIDLPLLLARLEEMREALERLKGWIERGLPEVPHEGSHTPESGCDINCMNEAQLSKDMGLVTSALRPLGEPR